MKTWKENERAAGNEYLRRLLWITGGNVAQAARLAQVNRTDFYKKLRNYGVEIVDRSDIFHRYNKSDPTRWDREIVETPLHANNTHTRRA